MLIKAGTYRFNDVLTELESGQGFQQSINLTITVTEGDVTGTFYVSKITILKGDYFGLIYDVYSLIIDGEEQLGGGVLSSVAYSSEDKVWAVSQTHTITEDTEVADDFGTWYIANTDYNTVNGGEGEETPITDLTGTTWYIPSGWSASARYGQFYVEGTVNGSNTNFIAIGYNDENSLQDSISYLDADVGIPKTITPTNDITLTITGGTDATNTTLSSWLQTYGELASEETTPTKKFARLYIGETVYSSNGKRFRKLQDTEYVEPSEPEDTESIIGTWLLNKDLEYWTVAGATSYLMGYVKGYTYSTSGEIVSRYISGITYSRYTSDSAIQGVHYNLNFYTSSGAHNFGYNLYYSNADNTYHGLNYDYIRTANFGLINKNSDEGVLLRTLIVEIDPKKENFTKWLKANATKL